MFHLTEAASDPLLATSYTMLSSGFLNAFIPGLARYRFKENLSASENRFEFNMYYSHVSIVTSIGPIFKHNDRVFVANSKESKCPVIIVYNATTLKATH